MKLSKQYYKNGNGTGIFFDDGNFETSMALGDLLETYGNAEVYKDTTLQITSSLKASVGFLNTMASLSQTLIKGKVILHNPINLQGNWVNCQSTVNLSDILIASGDDRLSQTVICGELGLKKEYEYFGEDLPEALYLSIVTTEDKQTTEQFEELIDEFRRTLIDICEVMCFELKMVGVKTFYVNPTCVWETV